MLLSVPVILCGSLDRARYRRDAPKARFTGRRLKRLARRLVVWRMAFSGILLFKVAPPVTSSLEVTAL